MKVDIWSDIRCPFCYIGKRKFELALDEFDNKEEVHVEWHSFELDPEMKSQKDINIYDYLAVQKGISKEQSIQMHSYVTETAREVGLNYDFEKTVVASSFDAQRLIQLAKQKGLDNDIEEALFKAYFIEGKDISDATTLIELGASLGIDVNEISNMLSSEAYIHEVREDEAAAQEIGVDGVPFFVFDNKYAVSGAQPSSLFLEVLQKIWEENSDNVPEIIDK